MKDCVGTVYSENRKVCILTHRETMHLECATFPAEHKSSYNVRFGCECSTKSTCFCVGLCEACYMEQVFSSTVSVRSKTTFQ